MKMDQEKKRALAVTAVFLVYLLCMAVWGILQPVKTFSEQENRFLQKQPEFSGKSFLSGKYTKDYETYITDQFPLRDHWISLKTVSERMLQKKEVKGVYFGQDGYLIEAHREEDIDKEQMELNTKYLLGFAENAEKLPGIQSVKIMLVPTADAVLTDKLPPFAENTWQSLYLEEIANSHTFLDVDKVLNQKKDQEIFYRTDHHWTTKGAFYAYEAWAEALGLNPYKEEEFIIKPVSEEFYGTIHSKVNIRTKPDTLYLYEPVPDFTYKITYDLGEREGTDLYDMGKLTGKDKYAVFLGGNSGLVQINTQKPQGDSKRKLLLIKDSYANCFLPFAVNHFDETQVVDLRYFNMPVEQYMEEEGFTDILVLYNIPNFVGEKNIKKL